MGIKKTIAKWLSSELRAENIGSYPLKDPALYKLFGLEDNDTGELVTVDTAMQTSAVFACVDLISRILAELSLKLYKTSKDINEEDKSNPLYWLLLDFPNQYQTDFEFKEFIMRSLLLHGNGYAEIVSTGGRAVDQLIPLDPTRVTPFWYKPYVKAYRYSDPFLNKERIIMFEEMLHIMRYPDETGLAGLSPIAAMKRSIGATIAAEKYGARFYKNNAIPSGILEHPSVLSHESRQNLIEDWARKYEGVSNRGKTIVLEEGMKYNQMAVTPEDAQFLETRKFNVNDIARIFGIQPHKIGDLEKATFSNIEQQDLEFVKDTMSPWCTCWEKAIKRDVFTEPQKRTHYVNFDFTDLLKGEQDKRYDSYSKGINNGFLSINEAREKEHMNPVDGGDQYFRSANTFHLNAPFKEPSQNNRSKDNEPIDANLIFKGNGVAHEQN